MRVEELMSRDVVAVAPTATLKEVASLLARHGISGVPVCDDDRRVLGVVSEADILLKEQGGTADGRGGLFPWLFQREDVDAAKLAARTAGEAMSAPAVTIEPGAAVAEAARLMLDRRVNRLPVVSRGRLVGIVTRADLVRAFQRPDAEIEREIADDVLVQTLWLDPQAVSLAVHDGEVTLSGRVETRTEAEIVDAYVRRVPGVVSVRSTLTWKVDDLARRRLRPEDRFPLQTWAPVDGSRERR